MTQGKITKRSVDSVIPGPGNVFLWDTELAGFGLKVTPKGKKIYIVQYRTGGRSAKTQRMTLGIHGALTPEKAREEAGKRLAAVQLGGDPAADRRRRRQEKTIGELADRYLREHARAHNKASTVTEVERIIENRIKPDLGLIKISELRRSRIKEWHQAKVDSPYAANRELAYLSKMLSLASGDWELRDDNPCRGIKKFPERKREAFFSDADLKRIGEALAESETRNEAQPGCYRAIRLLALTGMRLGEVLGLRWEDVDAEQGAIRLPDAKAGARTVPLAAPAQVLLEDMKRVGPFVCHNAAGDGPVLKGALHRLWVIVKVAAKVPHSRPHDFRHTVGTYAAQAGMNAFMVRDILGHKTLAMTGRYVERHADPMREAATAVANRVAAAMGSQASAEVIPIGGKAA